MEKKERTLGRTLLSLLIDIVIAVIIAAVIMLFIKPTVVKQESMLPNFQDGDYLIVNKMAYKSKLPRKGDVIVFWTDPEQYGEKKLLIKRVIGLPGDVIDIKNGEVFVNGEKDDQSYTKDKTTSDEETGHKVPEGKLYCLGDNRLNSTDSRARAVGDVDMDQVVGKAALRLLPFDRFGKIQNPYGE